MSQSGIRALIRRVPVVLAGMAFAATALGDPPPWAPAHGYRDKHADAAPPRHDRDGRAVIDIEAGRCNREAIGTIVGGVVGGVVGAEAGEGHEDGQLATLAGVLIGAAIGNRVGRSMDQTDRHCTGEALERAPDGRTVEWSNPETGARYHVTPTDSFEHRGRPCREFVTEARVGERRRDVEGTACRQSDGEWEVIERRS